MIEAENITKKFGNRIVLSEVSFKISPGEIYGVIGYNGVGKTTLLKILNGIYRPDSGVARICGEPVYENAEIKNQCFFMTEESLFFSQASMEDMRKFYRGYYPKWDDHIFYGLAKWFGVDPTKRVNQFSKGMQRQASLTLAFSTQARYFFLDEAFDGLDYTMRRQIREMLSYYTKEKEASVLISSHNLRELEEFADRIGMLNEGKLVYDGLVKEMKENYQTCRFVLHEEKQLLENPNLEILELEKRKWSGLEESEQSVYDYFCIVQGSKEDAYCFLKQIGAEQIQIRSVKLEEFFQRERNIQKIDWKQIFNEK